MDRPRSLAAFLVALFAVVAANAADRSAPALREMRWIEPGVPRASLIRLLTIQPGECLTVPAGEAAQQQVAIGRAMFQSPLLLGGQASRAGVSCASCHRAGRGNPHFAFPGVSGKPGTADVTSSLFSSKRGDGIANPRVIPDLVADLPQVDRDPAKPDLRRFVRGLIVEEFDGLEPSAAVLDGLVAYVGALGGTCSADRAQTVDIETDLIRASVGAAQRSLTVPDQPTAQRLIAAARSALGRIDERYATVAGVRQRLDTRDAELRKTQALAATDPKGAHVELDRWRLRFDRDVAVLRSSEIRSLYAPAMLGQILPAEVRVAKKP